MTRASAPSCCRAERAALSRWRCRADPRKYDSPLMFWHDGKAYLPWRVAASPTTGTTTACSAGSTAPRSRCRTSSPTATPPSAARSRALRAVRGPHRLDARPALARRHVLPRDDQRGARGAGDLRLQLARRRRQRLMAHGPARPHTESPTRAALHAAVIRAGAADPRRDAVGLMKLQRRREPVTCSCAPCLSSITAPSVRRALPRVVALRRASSASAARARPSPR